MRLTRAGEYAIRCLLHLARHPFGSVIPRHEIAQAMDIPYPFLGKIGPKLAAAGFIRIAQGAYGGYALFRPAEEITLLDVVEAVEGIIFLNDCLMSENACHHRPTCAVHKVWHQARAGLREVLGSVHFAQLATEACAFESAGGSAEERE